MVKFFIYITKIVLTILLGLLAASCQVSINEFPTIKGNGNVITQTRDLSENINAVEISQGLQLELTQGEKLSLIVEADENLHDHIITKTENGVLTIKSDRGIRSAKAKKIKLEFVHLENIIATSAAKVKSTNTLKGQHLELKSSSGADIDLAVEYETILSKASSGSEIELSGKALSLEAVSSSGSSINSKELWTNDVTAKASSGATVKVYPILSLKAKASSGGDILYYNIPKNISKRLSSGGSAKEKH